MQGAVTVAIFGATGRTGAMVLREALTRGWHVRILVRDAKKVPHDIVQNAGDRLAVLDGSIEADKVRATLGGENGPFVSAVLSTLGPVSNAKADAGVITRALECIVAEMQRAKIRRLVMTAGAGVSQAGDKPGFVDKVIRGALGLFAAQLLADMTGACAVVQAAPDIDWTIARAPRLIDGEAAGEPKVGMVGTAGMGISVSRGTLARFVVDAVEKASHIREAPMVSD